MRMKGLLSCHQDVLGVSIFVIRKVQRRFIVVSIIVSAVMIFLNCLRIAIDLIGSMVL